MNIWKVRKSKNDYNKTAEAFGVSNAFAKVLSDIEMDTLDLYEKYTNPALKNIGNFTDSKDLDLVCDTIKKFVEKGEKITFFSDYDCDGVTSTTIAYKAFKEIFPMGNIEYFVPHRVYDGYGLNIESIKELSKLETKLLITLDNGITALKEIDFANELGMTVLILDHHEVLLEDNGNEILPKALGILDSKQKTCNYSFKHLCTAGLVYLFSHYLAKKNNVKLVSSSELLQFATIGTVVDIVDLTKDNKIIVKKGLESLNNGVINLGLKKLMEVAGFSKEINEITLGFVIGPMINSIGRLDHAKKAVELFLTDDETLAKNLAEEIFNANINRKALTDNSLNSVEKIIIENEFYKDDIIVVYDKDIHESLAGNIASKIKDKYNKPTFVITRGEGCAKGSARGIEVYDIVEGMTKCSTLLNKFGGHKLAGGFSLREEKIFDFRKKLNDDTNFSPEDFLKEIYVNKIIDLNEATYELYCELQKLSPFGKGNEAPIFASLNTKVVAVRYDEAKRYFKLEVIDKSIKYSMTVIAFGENEKFKNMIFEKYGEYEGEKILGGVLRKVEIFLDIVYNIDINIFNNNTTIQLKPIDFRFSNMNK
ncbi:MAG: single-stranded-DNA-specific exonuclease RecJ [Lachnospirales bacterium]